MGPGLRGADRRVRVRTRRGGRGARALPLILLAVMSGGGSAAGGGRRASWRGPAVEEPPWHSGNGGVDRRDIATPDALRAVSATPPWAAAPRRAEPSFEKRGARAARSDPVHPAVHGERRRADTPLFPRAGRVYTVRPGDTLWDVARRALGTDDVRRVARYWPRIHRANRAVIGDNPDLILPGQKLVLPREIGPRG